MANIRENKKNGKTISYRFTAYLGRDEQGKQVRRYTTWKPADGLTPAKARKAAERAAEQWELNICSTYQKGRLDVEQGHTYQIPPEKRQDDFIEFIDNIWLTQQIRGRDNKPSTIAYYEVVSKGIKA